MFHKGVPRDEGVQICRACRIKIRNRGRKASKAAGHKPRTMFREDWDKVDFTKGPRYVSLKLKVGIQAAYYNAKRLGWKRVSFGLWQQDPTQMRDLTNTSA